MGLIIKDKVIIHTIEFENLYATIENFRRLSDSQMEVNIGFYKSIKDKVNGVKPLDTEIKVLNITKNHLSVLPIYVSLYAKLGECYLNSVAVTVDDISESPTTITIKNNEISGKVGFKDGIVNVGYNYLNKLATIPVTDGSFSFNVESIGMPLHDSMNLTFMAKEIDKKFSEPVVTKIIESPKGVFRIEVV